MKAEVLKALKRKVIEGHTPGPWTACNKGKCQCGRVSSYGADSEVATITRGAWGDEYAAIRVEEGIGGKAEAYMEMIEYGEVPIPEAEQNAHLIATAPDLQAENAVLREAVRE